MEEVPITAMIDTGSSVTIVSLDYLFATLAKGRSNEEMPAQWQARVKARLQPTSIQLRSYSGDGLPIVKQIQVQLHWGSFVTESWIQMQKHAPVDFLLGMDLEPSLDFVRPGSALKPNKCTFIRKQVEYLSYIVSGASISTDPSKVQAVQDFPVPSDLKTLRSFLGLTSNYRRFMPNYSALANFLYALTRKDVTFEWSDECQQAFDRLKESLTHAPILAILDFTQDFHVETDASGAGLDAILAQSGLSGGRRPIAFASRTLQAHECNYGSTKLEALGMVWAVKHFRQYLYGHRCHVYIDHEALKAFLDTPHLCGKLARWGLVLQELDLTIHYQPGRKNQRADALSRYPTGCQSAIEESFAVVATTSIETGSVATHWSEWKEEFQSAQNAGRTTESRPYPSGDHMLPGRRHFAQ